MHTDSQTGNALVEKQMVNGGWGFGYTTVDALGAERQLSYHYMCGLRTRTRRLHCVALPRTRERRSVGLPQGEEWQPYGDRHPTAGN